MHAFANPLCGLFSTCTGKIKIRNCGSIYTVYIRGLHIGIYPPPPSGCHLGEKFENEKRKRGKMLKK
jgi:hypothetical protein